MSIEVNGHKLPPLLVKLIEEGRWAKGKILPEHSFAELLIKKNLPSTAMDMYVVESMKRQSSDFVNYWLDDFIARAQIFENYGIASSKETGQKLNLK